MKKQSEAEWLVKHLNKWCIKTGSDWDIHPALARSILAALKRRGWTPPKPKKKGRGK